jgi:hypothetical protein
MEKTNTDNSPKNKAPIEEERKTADKQIKQGGENSTFPQEYEEDQSMALRMKPQPFVQPGKKKN